MSKNERGIVNENKRKIQGNSRSVNRCDAVIGNVNVRFAAAVTYTNVAGVESGDDYEVTVTYNAADVAEGDYVTVLVTVGSADLMFAEGDTTSPTNVIYVDQKVVTAGEGTFVFKAAKDIVANKDVFVKLGATNQATAAAGNKKFEVTTPGGDKLEVETSTDVLSVI